MLALVLLQKKCFFKKGDQWLHSHEENNASTEPGYLEKFWSRADIEMGHLRNSVPVPRSVAFIYYHNVRENMCVNIAPLLSFLM